jgi:hypothetical protein
VDKNMMMNPVNIGMLYPILKAEDEDLHRALYFRVRANCG